MPLRKNKNTYIVIFATIVIVAIVLALVLKIKPSKFSENITPNREDIKIVDITPKENSKVLASKKGFSIDIIFNTNAEDIFNLVEIKDNFGLRWEKEIYGKDLINFSTKFGNEIMSLERLEINLLYDKEVIRSWSYNIPIDENVTGPMVNSIVEEGATFIPSQEDIKYFAELQKVVDQEQPMWKLLPYETEKFKISHYIEPLTLVVYIKGDHGKTYIESEVKNWISENGGVASQHKIEWR